MMHIYYCPVCWRRLDPRGHIIPRHSDNARTHCPASGEPLRICIQQPLPFAVSDELVLAAATNGHRKKD